MAKDTNMIIMTGRLTKDPEMRFTVDGVAITSFDIAVNGIKDKDVMYIRCTTWNKLAEIAGEYLKKGKKILVNGSLKISTVKKEDTVKYFTSINVHELQFLDGNKQEEGRSIEGDTAPQVSEQSGTFPDIPF